VNQKSQAWSVSWAQTGSRVSCHDVQEFISQNHGPIMVHESVATATLYASRSHPRRVFSFSYELTGFFQGESLGEKDQSLWRTIEC
jgi:hypothetical protein